RDAHCRVVGHVAEQIGGLGTLVAAGSLRCEGLAPATNAGTILFWGLNADAGARVVSVGTLMPLNRQDSFDLARFRLGAAARFVPTQTRVGTVDGTLNRIAARIRGGLHAATSSLPSAQPGMLDGFASGDTAGMHRA